MGSVHCDRPRHNRIVISPNARQRMSTTGIESGVCSFIHLPIILTTLHDGKCTENINEMLRQRCKQPSHRYYTPLHTPKFISKIQQDQAQAILPSVRQEPEDSFLPRLQHSSIYTPSFPNDICTLQASSELVPSSQSSTPTSVSSCPFSI